MRRRTPGPFHTAFHRLRPPGRGRFSFTSTRSRHCNIMARNDLGGVYARAAAHFMPGKPRAAPAPGRLRLEMGTLNGRQRVGSRAWTRSRWLEVGGSCPLAPRGGVEVDLELAELEAIGQNAVDVDTERLARGAAERLGESDDVRAWASESVQRDPRDAGNAIAQQHSERRPCRPLSGEEESALLHSSLRNQLDQLRSAKRGSPRKSRVPTLFEPSTPSLSKRRSGGGVGTFGT